MAISNWKRIFENKIQEGRTGKIVFFTKDNIYETHPFNQEWVDFLINTNANVGDVRIFMKDEFIFLVGVEKIEGPFLKRGAAMAAPVLKNYGVKNVYFADTCDFSVEGFILGNFSYKMVIGNDKIIFVDGNCFPGQVQNFARFLSETPANLMTPSIFAEYAFEYVKFCGLDSIKILGLKEIQEKKMGLLLGVSNGSNEEPKLIHIQYRGKESEEIDLTLVGKGVTFDSGGISLKPPKGMSDMKADMMGAAAVLAAAGYAIHEKLKINLDVVIPLTENLPSGSATKPGDVHISMSGKSVEIENTDAEGRLILADAITFAQEFKPKRIIDVATLTGAMMIALGTVKSGLFSNSDRLAELIFKASNYVDDPCWRLPICEEYKSCFESETADLQNTGGRYGGSIKAALFLKQFVNTDWAHIDIAGVMNDSHDKVLYGKGMTGRPVRLLIEVIKRLQE